MHPDSAFNPVFIETAVAHMKYFYFAAIVFPVFGNFHCIVKVVTVETSEHGFIKRPFVVYRLFHGHSASVESNYSGK